MQAIESIPVFRTRQAAPTCAAKEATPIGLDARRDALQSFVGQVVSDNDMAILYYRAHRAGAVLTSEWMADTLPCDHRVTGYYPAL